MQTRFCWQLTAALLFMPSIVWAQERSLLNAQLPTGEIGRTQVQRRPELANVWQPVLVRVADGATLAFAEGGGFSYSQGEAQLVSLLVGTTYRLKVSNIPQSYGDVYPTIELIDRLHPPPGKETRYPVPVEITDEELKMALAGKFVTRVIYVEDPRNAVGGRELPEQRYFEALLDEDPYEVASRIGRPIAILRMGSVVPNAAKMHEFMLVHRRYNATACGRNNPNTSPANGTRLIYQPHLRSVRRFPNHQNSPRHKNRSRSSTTICLKRKTSKSSRKLRLWTNPIPLKTSRPRTPVPMMLTMRAVRKAMISVTISSTTRVRRPGR